MNEFTGSIFTCEYVKHRWGGRPLLLALTDLKDHGSAHAGIPVPFSCETWELNGEALSSRFVRSPILYFGSLCIRPIAVSLQKNSQSSSAVAYFHLANFSTDSNDARARAPKQLSASKTAPGIIECAQRLIFQRAL